MAASRTVASAGFGLTARTKPFRRGMRRAAKSTGVLTKALGVLRSKAFVFGAALSAAATGGGLGLLVKSSFKSIDALGKTSDKLGTTTEALAGLRLAANLTGTETKQLDVGIQRMTRRIAEAAQGTGEAKKAIAELGLDAAKLGEMTPTEQFSELARVFETVQTKGDRIRLGFKLFDAEGVGLINTLALGADGLEDVAREADLLGLSLSRIEVKQIEDANDAVTLVKSAFQGLGNTLAIEVAPFVKFLALKFKDMIVDAGGFGVIASKGMGLVVKAIGFVLDAVDALAFSWDIARLGVALLVRGVVENFNMIGNTIAQIPHFMDVAVARAAEYFLRAVDVMGQAVVDLINLIPGVEIAWNQTARSMADGLALAIEEKVGPEHIDFTGGVLKGLDETIGSIEDGISDKLEKGVFETSDRFEAWFADVKKSSFDAAKGVIDDTNKTTGAGQSSTSTAIAKTTGAATRGSAEAFKAIHGQTSDTKTLVKLNEQQLVESRVQNARLSETVTSLGDVLDAIEGQVVGV